MLARLMKQDAPTLALADAVEQGLPAKVLRQLTPEPLSWSEMAALIAPRRTLERRLSGDGQLTRDESDRFVRVSRIVDLAVDTFGDAGEAGAWLRSPLEHFEGRAPIHVMATEVGARLVEDHLQRGRWGATA